MSLFLTFLLGVITLYVLAFLLFYFFQEKFFIHPCPLKNTHEFKFQDSFEESFAEPCAGVRLNVLKFKAKKPTKTLVFFVHGNRDHMGEWGKEAHRFLRFGYDCLFYDYRSYGKSQGTYRTQNDFYKEALFIFDQHTADYEQIIVVGRSLGSGVASYLAAARRVEKLILLSPYESFKALLKYKYPLMPLGCFLRYRFDPAFFVSLMHKTPVAILHGEKDDVTPLQGAHAIARLDPARIHLKVLPGVGHKVMLESQMDGFLDEVLGPAKTI